MAKCERFTASVDDVGDGRARFVFRSIATRPGVPKRHHHVRGTVAGKKVCGPPRLKSEGWALRLGAAWLRNHPLPSSGEVTVVLEAEGPQAADLARDVAAAFESAPEAAALFAGLATFYRKGYLRWIDGPPAGLKSAPSAYGS